MVQQLYIHWQLDFQQHLKNTVHIYYCLSSTNNYKAMKEQILFGIHIFLTDSTREMQRQGVRKNMVRKPNFHRSSKMSCTTPRTKNCSICMMVADYEIPATKEVHITSGKSVISKSCQIPEWTLILQTMKKVATSICLPTVGKNAVLILVGKVLEMPKINLNVDLWTGFGMGKHI